MNVNFKMKVLQKDLNLNGDMIRDGRVYCKLINLIGSI